MSQVLIFNHHSLPFDSLSSARAAVPEFIHVTLHCSRYGYNLLLLDESIDPDWFQMQLAPGYVWRNWYDEACSDSDLKEVVRAFRSLKTRQPLLTATDLKKIGFCKEVGLKGDSTGLPALLACHFYGSFLISFPSCEKWKKSELQAWVHDLVLLCFSEGYVTHSHRRSGAHPRYLPYLSGLSNQSFLRSSVILT